MDELADVRLEQLTAELAWIRRLAYALVRDRDDADDISHETWLAARDRLPDGRPLRPWLIRIAHNLAANYHRDKARRPTAALDNVEPVMHPHGTERVVEGLGAAGGEARALGATIKQLAPRWFVMRDARRGGSACLVQPREAMSWMKGPMTRAEIKAMCAAATGG